MMGTTHATTGATAWLVGCETATLVGVHPSLLGVAAGTVVCAAGALVPDFDHPSSLASRSLWPATAILSWATRAVSRAVYRATSTPLDERRGDAGTHRALTHTWPFALVVGVLAAAALGLAGLRWPLVGAWWWLGLVLGAGCLVHTLGDALTHSGVPLLWPFASRGRRWRRVGAPLRFSTGKWFEKVVFVVAVAVGFSALWLLLPALAAAVVPAAVSR
jgi:membrane-bound metal-dependent hydrolase YbcI (DUF457 family)